MKIHMVKNLAGQDIDYNTAIYYMDDDICRELAPKMAPCTEQEFFRAYEKAHAEKFGEEWELSKDNPVY